MNKFLKLLGLFFVLLYMINIYYIWFDANLSGYTYFSAGEPNLYIKYSEWIGGILGIVSLISIIKETIRNVYFHTNH